MIFQNHLTHQRRGLMIGADGETVERFDCGGRGINEFAQPPAATLLSLLSRIAHGPPESVEIAVVNFEEAACQASRIKVLDREDANGLRIQNRWVNAALR